MIKKLTLITILLLGNIAFSQEPKLVDKYLFATLKGKIDDKYDITMNIQIFDVYSLAGGMTTEIMGNYNYDRFGKNIYFTKGTINKNSMIIEAEGDEVFTFKLDEATLKNILELKNSSKKITINGNWENKSKKFSCVINSVSPLGGKLSEIYKYNISGEVAYDDYYKYYYDEDALYSPSMNVSYFYEEFTNVEKIDVKTLKNIMKGNFKRFTIYDRDKGKAFFTNDFRIGYFDNKILCLEEYEYEFNGGVHGVRLYFDTIISLEMGKKLNNELYKDLVNYSKEFREFFRKEFIKYHIKYNKDVIEFYKIDFYKMSEEEFDMWFFPKYNIEYDYEIIFNNDGTIDIYNYDWSEHFSDLRKTKIEMKKLKPYIRKDSFYKYLFNWKIMNNKIFY